MTQQPALSVITVCMNRQHHLYATAQRIAAWPHHQEHLILDWSSHDPIDRTHLPDDPRIRLERVDGECRWNLSRAYNFAVQLAGGSLLLKLDADCWPDQLDPALLRDFDPHVCRFGSGPDGRLGQFLMHRSAITTVGGFNEYLLGYGFDDKDLRSRLRANGFLVLPLPINSIDVIAHTVHERVGIKLHSVNKSSSFEDSLSAALKRSSSMRNRVVVAYMPWSSRCHKTKYVEKSTGGWYALQDTIPQLPDQVNDEIARLERATFWGSLLLIPDEIVKKLPVKLLGLKGVYEFEISWFHRVYWYLVCSLLILLVRPLEPKFWKKYHD